MMPCTAAPLPRLLVRLIFAILPAALLLAGCGDAATSGDTATGAIAVQPLWPGEEEENTALSAEGSGVTLLRATITAPDLTEPLQQDFGFATTLVTIEGVPAGSARTLTLQGLDDADTVLFQGASGELTVSASATLDAGQILLAVAMAPAAPATLTATPGDEQVTLEWPEVPLATGYRLYWGEAAGVTPETGTLLDDVISPYDHTELTNGQPYSYVVTAFNHLGESGASPEAGGTPMPPAPGAPTVSATAGDGEVELEWELVTGAAYYTVYRSTVSGEDGTLAASPEATEYLDDEVANGTTYFYRVGAVDAFDVEGELSAQVSAMPQAAAPDAPMISNLRNLGVAHSGFVTGTSSGATSVEVSVDGGSYAEAAGIATWRYPLPAGANTWRDGSEHTITVRAWNGGSASDTTTITVRKGNNRDVNGDGYADLAAGEFNSGTAYVFHSSGADGITGTLASEAATTITGEPTGTLFAEYFALGDVNGDGYADLVVGAPAYSSSRGRIYVFHSSGTDGITATTAVSGTGGPNATVTGGASLNGFGVSVATGDVNGDGYADVAVGAQNYSANTGRVYVFHSSSSGVTATDTSGANTTVTGTGSSFFGNTVALGDVNGDGYADLAAGANGAQRVYLFHSSGSGISATLTSGANTNIDGSGTSLGSSIALGDVNRDGYADLVAGGPSYSSGTGRVYVFHSSASGIPATTTVAGTGGPNSTITGEAISNSFGASVAVGDLNSDGYADVVAGSSNYSSGDGRTYVLHSSSSGVAASLAASADTKITGEALAGFFGGSVTVADLNGDGSPDLIAGAYSLGRVYAFHGSGVSGISATTTAGASTTITGPGAFGYWLAP